MLQLWLINIFPITVYVYFVCVSFCLMLVEGISLHDPFSLFFSVWRLNP